MDFEQKINYQLNKYPAVKRMVKRMYQLGMYTISPKTKDTWSDVSPKDKLEILLLDTLANTAVVVAESNSWNVQTRVYGSFWKNDDKILAFENKHSSGPGYYLM